MTGSTRDRTPTGNRRPLHHFASSQPYWAREDIKIAKGNINLWGLGGVQEGSAPPPPPPPCRLALAG